MIKIDISFIDSLVICLYLISILTVAYFSSRTFTSDNSPELIKEQYLAGKSLTFWESLCSIIATEVSALTFLGIPAFAFTTDFSFLQIYLGAIFGRFIIAKFFLPKVYNEDLTIFETISKEKSTKNGRRSVAFFYLISKVLSIGVRLFSGSILISVFFDLNIHFAIFLICLITFLYTLVGGLKAVVRTDMLQMALFVFGGIVAHIYIPKVSGDSWLNLMDFAFQNGKMNLFDPLEPLSLLTGVVGGILFDMGTHGVDQDFVQRLTGSKSLKTAQKVIFITSFFSIVVGLLFLGIGALLWSHYQTHLYPEGIKPDELFAYFITNYFPEGIRGLMVAGVLAATMSTLDSTINALSACFYNDILIHKFTDLKKIKKSYIRDTFTITFFLYIVAYLSSHSDKLLLLGLKIQSWTGGSLLAIFFAKIIWKKWFNPVLDARAIIGAFVFGVLSVYINTEVLEFPWQWNVYAAFISSLLFLKIHSHLRAEASPLERP